VVARYPAAVLADTKHAVEATDFVDWLASTAGHDVLAKSGFARP
jgi:ABC-type molybdate transport system substrate-binding protein